MNDKPTEFDDRPMTQEELHAAMFAQMVMQFASTALMLMGRMPNPMTGKTETDLDAARMFIEQLEMLEVKTKGNLGTEEQHPSALSAAGLLFCSDRRELLRRHSCPPQRPLRHPRRSPRSAAPSGSPRYP